MSDFFNFESNEDANSEESFEDNFEDMFEVNLEELISTIFSQQSIPNQDILDESKQEQTEKQITILKTPEVIIIPCFLLS